MSVVGMGIGGGMSLVSAVGRLSGAGGVGSGDGMSGVAGPSGWVVLAAVLAGSAVLAWPRRRPRLPQGPPRPPLPRPTLRERLTRRRRSRDPAWVAEFAELTALGLGAGLAVGEAARLAADVASVPDAVNVRSFSADHAVTQRDSPDLACSELAFLAATWELSEELGAPAAPATAQAARVVRGHVESAQRRSVLLAGPRTSMLVLTLLPLLGPAAVLALGAPLGDTYLAPLPLAVTCTGLALTAAGWLVSRALLSRAARAAALDGGSAASLPAAELAGSSGRASAPTPSSTPTPSATLTPWDPRHPAR